MRDNTYLDVMVCSCRLLQPCIMLFDLRRSIYFNYSCRISSSVYCVIDTVSFRRVGSPELTRRYLRGNCWRWQ